MRDVSRNGSCARAFAVAVLLCASGAAGARTADSQEEYVPAEFFYKLYPEWKVQHFGTPSKAGTDVGNMGTLRNDTTLLSKDASPKAATDDHAWSNSYIGLRGWRNFPGVKVGYDVEGLIDFQGSVRENFATHEAYVYADSENWGRLALGKMDSIYKDVGDQVTLLGITSSNFVSTSRVLSGVAWRAAGDTTFHNRVNNTARWDSPAWHNVIFGVSHSFRPGVPAPHGHRSLTAAAVRWQEGPWYAALATEVHRNWFPVSLAADTPAPSATSIRNPMPGTSSHDQAWRATLAWTGGEWRVGTDVARLHYSEDSTTALPGKFRNYANYTGQVTAEYRWKSLRLAANHARGTAGTCELSGGVACSTHGLGGAQTSVGAMLDLTSVLSVFAIRAQWHNNPASLYGSSAQGAGTYAYAFGVKLAMR